MTMLNFDIGHARPARLPDTKAALAPGAAAITIIQCEAGCTFRVGSKDDLHSSRRICPLTITFEEKGLYSHRDRRPTHRPA
jgi:hypothetical protein